jgi:histidinol-phosphatase
MTEVTADMTDLDRCLRLADAADPITLQYYRSIDLHITTKPDKTPVTNGDLAADAAMHKIATEEFGDAYLTEEGDTSHHTGRQWVIDPIDGTKNYLRGVPLWATLIALVDNGETITACVSAPALGRRWWAAKGQGSWTKDVDGTTKRIHVSGVSALEDAFLLTSTPLAPWDKTASSERAVRSLLDSVWRYRMPGDFINYMWLAEGAADACFEPYAKQWDVEACKLIVTEAGGSFWSSATADTPATAERCVVATNGPLESPILAALNLKS